MKNLGDAISMKHVFIYLSMHHLVDAAEADIVNGSFNEKEWLPVFKNYFYHIKENTILKRFAQDNLPAINIPGELVNVWNLLEAIACGSRPVPVVSADFSF
ncbi:MAG: hypothetical protein PHC61_08605 [Chitinivibrionales bacterium]|nr:hypothetical protein [Chitinivibrionales bacterium]